MNGNVEKQTEADVLKAECVYLIMKKDYRISRNVRAQWFLEHLNTMISTPSLENLAVHQEELSLISVVPHDPPAEWTPGIQGYQYLVTPATVVVFLAEKYRMVFCLDVSPSLSAVDIQLGDVMIDGMFQGLKQSLEGLTKPFLVPGSSYTFEPEIYATIIVHTPFFTNPAQQVIVQGWQVTAMNLPLLLSIVQQQLHELEGRVAEVSTLAQERLDILRAESEKLVGGLFEDSLQPTSAENPMVSPDTGFINMLRFGMLALKLLPDSSSANIVVITDGIINIPDVNVFDSVLTQLRSSTVACSFIQVSGKYHPYCCKGFVPYTELMQFIAAATLGAYISSASKLATDNSSSLQMNIYHTAFLTWSFQKRVKEFVSKTTAKKVVEWPVSNQYLGSKDRFLIRKKQVEDNLNTSLKNVLSCRLREGYTIKNVNQQESHIDVSLVLPWKNNIYIEYSLSAPWPHPALPVHYTVFIEAPYEFLHDITCLLKKPFKSHYRQAVVSRFWHTLKTLAHTDQLLVHLHSFTNNVASHSLPESIRSGMPLFYLPANANTPALTSSDSLYPQFSSFWKPVCLLDAAVWQKWLHPHRIGLLLQHDHPLPRHLHLANPSGRFQQVQCRQAASVLYSTLKNWSSFVLIENHSFVKLIQGDAAKIPHSFLLVRVTSKPPCVLLDLAFLGGTTGRLRHEIVDTLKKKISNLMLPQRPLARDSIIRKVSTVKNQMAPADEEVKSGRSPNAATLPAAPVSWSDLSCCILLNKPVEKILIRYERMPSDFTTVVFPDGTQPLSGKPVATAAGGSMLTTLSRYLHHRRWIWVAQHGMNPSVSSAALTRTLSTITKMRIQEGFCFAHSTAGIINMLLEVEMKTNGLPGNDGTDHACIHPCVIQYVLFPPHLINIRESGSDEDGNDDSEIPDSDGELQIITECWIEPQYGRVVNSPQERYYMEGLSYDQLADEICRVDAECISSLLTFEHLTLLSQEGVSTAVPISKALVALNLYKGDTTRILPEERINYMPFAFSLMNLLPKCQQAELLFSVFIQDLSWSLSVTHEIEGFSYLDTPNKLLLEMFYDNLQRIHGSEIYLSPEDSQSFVGVLRMRERDSKAYPFQLPIPELNKFPQWGRDKPHNLCDGRLKASKHTKWRCFLKQMNSTHLILTFVPASYSDLKLLMLVDTNIESRVVKFFETEVGKLGFESRTNPFGKESDLQFKKESNEKIDDAVSIPESQSVPEIKDPSEAYLNLDPTDLRPSLHHLNKNLVNSPFRVRANSLDTMAKKPGFTELRKRTRTCSMDSRHKKKYSLQPLSPPQLTLDNSADLRTSLVTETKEMCIPIGHSPKYGSITFPVYVYDCPLSSLIDVLVYKEYEKRPRDIYVDSTYSRMSDEQLKANSEDMKTSPMETVNSNTSPEPKSEESEASNERQWLKQHYILIQKSYTKTFVLSLFKSLQLSHFVHSVDVQKAVEECEETEIEIDITKFIQAVCGHLKDFWLKRNIELHKGIKPSEDGTADKLPLSFFKQPEHCQNLYFLHLLIKGNFFRILSDFFRVVPSNREFYYCAPNWERERQIDQLNLDTELQRTGEPDEGDVSFEMDYRGEISKVQATSLNSRSWERSSAATLDTRTSDSVSDLPDEESYHELCPLFFHLLCAVQYKNSTFRQPISILPTCLVELEKSLVNLEPELDITALKVYLDIHCLTLPAADVKITENPPNTPTIPTIIHSAPSSVENLVTTTELKTEDIAAKLCHIPDHQVRAVTTTISEVQWLLQDEMAGFLLDVFPPSESTLHMVAQHIYKSTNRITCLTETVSLLFVYDAEHGLEKFLEIFSNMSLYGYYLRREGKYFYLVQDKNVMSHKQSYLTAPQGIISLATPSSLAEDSSELWNVCFPMDPSKAFSGLYSDSELQALHMIDSTPTDDPLLRPYTNSKLHSPFVEGFRVGEDTKRYRRISTESEVKKEGPPHTFEGPWIESCSSSIPTPSLELIDKDDGFGTLAVEDVTMFGTELVQEVWDMKSRLPKQCVTCVKASGTSGRESPVAFSRQISSNLRARHYSGAPSTPGPNSEVSSIIESGQGTEDGYEGGSSDGNSAEDLTGEWPVEQDDKHISLPHFWLIMEVLKNCVITYFHCRVAGQSDQEISMYKDTRHSVIERILCICKLVNQMALLQRLHNTRICDELLEPDQSNDPWKQDTPKNRTNEADGGSSGIETAKLFAPRSFACNVVWETQFILHPRLKMGPAKRGIQALKSVLTRFAVNNRKNMFVYQDKTGNVFYLRLQESSPSMIGNKLTTPNVQAKSTDGEATPPGTLSVSRSSSISSLMARKTPVDDTLSFKMELRPRVRSFGERDSAVESASPRAEDSVVLKVHGISDAGPEIKEQLVQVLHNRLADAVLELLCVMLSRNPMCKLTPDDVHFIQKPYNNDHKLLQDYSRSIVSKERVQEDDIFLYNQSPTCGSKGMACIALAIIDSKGHLIQYNNFPSTNTLSDTEIFFEKEFEALTETKSCSTDDMIHTRVEFRIWEQGRVNIDSLSKKLLSAIQHATWDLLMEFTLLKASLSQEVETAAHSEDKIFTENVEEPTMELREDESPLEKLEAGECGQLHFIYQQVMCKWLNYAIDIGVPAVKKHTVVFKARQSLAVSLKELQRLVNVNASDTTVAVFKLLHKNKQETYIPFQSVPSFASDTRWDDANSSTICLLVGRNLQQWKACTSENAELDPDILYPKAQKVFQKFPPLLISSDGKGDKSSPTSGKSNIPCVHFVPRQRLLVATLSNKEVVIFTYNWSKDRSENLNKQVTNLGNWLVGRSNLITSIISQKLGLFNNQAYKRQSTDIRKGILDQTHLTVKDVEQLVKSPATAQKEFLSVGRRSNTIPTVCIQDTFRDIKPSRNVLRSSSDPVLCNGQQLLELSSLDKKESQKKLYQLWQTRVATPNIPVTDDVLQLLKQNSRVTHFCLTPLLFLPSWRIQAAATRDHTLAPQSPTAKQEMKSLLSTHSRHESGNSMKSNDGNRSLKSGASPQTSPKSKRNHEDKWHQKLCTHFIQEYKQYLTHLGFVAIQTEQPSPKKNVSKSTAASGTSSGTKEERQRKLSGPAALAMPSQQARRSKEEIGHFMQKSLLGGILIFEVLLTEPFFQAKLHVLECSRLQNKSSSGLISQFIFGFLDECDKIKIYMHLHSFTYDYHLRSIHNYISNQQSVLRSSFHLTNFINDFIKYYSKGPNYARNLVYSDSVCVTNTSTPAKQLYDFLWTHEDLYQMEVCCMSPETDCFMENEYVLVQLKNAHHVTYKDNHDTKQTDDFDVTLIVAHEQVDGAGNNTLHLKYYIILTSRKQEAVNYMGYYSSHEQLMQQLILQQASAVEEQVLAMVKQGMVHCRTHILWESLLSSSSEDKTKRKDLSYDEFCEMLKLASVESLSLLDHRLGPLLCQSLSWYQGLDKVMSTKYGNEVVRRFASPDSSVQYTVVLSPNYLEAFTMLSIDVYTSRGELSVVCKKIPQCQESNFNVISNLKLLSPSLQSLIEGFVNACCFHLWAGLV